MKKTFSLLILALALLCLTACGNEETIEVSKTAFPEITGTDMNGNPVSNEIFSDYDVTIVNFWSNGCGTCIEEMPELENYYQTFKDENINLIGVGADSGESEEKLAFAKKVLSEKGVTYMNISPDVESAFYKEFIPNLTGFPTTFVVNKNGEIIGAAIVGNVKNQDEQLQNRIELAKE